MTTNEKRQQAQDEIKESIHKVWLAGLGAVAMAEEEGTKFLNSLMEKGESYESRGRERFDEVRDKVDDATGKAKERAESTFDKVSERFDDAVSAALRRLGVPGRDEIAALTQRVEELTKVVEQLGDAKAPDRKSRKSAAKKTADTTAN